MCTRANASMWRSCRDAIFREAGLPVLKAERERAGLRFSNREMRKILAAHGGCMDSHGTKGGRAR